MPEPDASNVTRLDPGALLSSHRLQLSAGSPRSGGQKKLGAAQRLLVLAVVIAALLVLEPRGIGIVRTGDRAR
jgi:hypothetical protein